LIAPWVDKYFDVPWDDEGTDGAFTGCNCYGLVRLIFQEEFGICLPRYEGAAYSRSVDKEELGKRFQRERQQWKSVEFPMVGDVIWLRIAGHPFHVGVMVSSDQFMHIEEGCGPAVESITSPLWVRRINGFARW
jgi:cell wall-associated NlpC family hydrolase